MMKIGIASDHAGFELKRFLKEQAKEIQFVDYGPSDTQSVDYPDFAEKACRALQKGEIEKAILVCGSGIGMSIAANKLQGIRAAHVESSFTARLAGEHNRANVLCLGERVTGAHYALAMVREWLSAEFGGPSADPAARDRHQKRIDKIHRLEKN